MIIFGGIRIDTDGMELVAVNSVRVPFTSSHDARHQIYVGRRFYGETQSDSDREFIVTVGQEYRWPEHIQAIAVTGDHQGRNHEDQLPPRPYNRVEARFRKDEWEGETHEIDVRFFELFTGTEPDGAIDYDSPLDWVAATEDVDEYRLMSPPKGPTGDWNAAVRGRDHTQSAGNAGTEVERSQFLLCHAPDFGSPFEVAISGGLATIGCTLPGRTA